MLYITSIKSLKEDIAAMGCQEQIFNSGRSARLKNSSVSIELITATSSALLTDCNYFCRRKIKLKKKIAENKKLLVRIIIQW